MVLNMMTLFLCSKPFRARVQVLMAINFSSDIVLSCPSLSLLKPHCPPCCSSSTPSRPLLRVLALSSPPSLSAGFCHSAIWTFVATTDESAPLHPLSPDLLIFPITLNTISVHITCLFLLILFSIFSSGMYTLPRQHISSHPPLVYLQHLELFLEIAGTW